MRGISRWIGSVLCIGLISIALVGCGGDAKKQGNIAEKQVLQIAALNGPTGIGMAKLMEENKGDYEVTLYQSADEVIGKVVSGEIDIACVPSNLGAVLYNKTDKGIRLLATNTLGTLYVVENEKSITGLSDLKGKTIYASGKGSAPEYILKHVLLANGINPDTDLTVTYLANHADIASQLVANKGTVALLPQPFVSTVTMKDEAVEIVIDVNEEWTKIEEVALPMGIIIGQAELIKEQQAAVAAFLTAYEQSIAYATTNVAETAKLVEQYGIVANAKVAELAIPMCNLTYLTAQDSRALLEPFYTTLYNEDPKAVGGALPDETFYSMD